MDIQQVFDRLWDFDHPAQSEQRFLAFVDSLDPPDLRAQALTQIARAQGLQGKFEQAQKTLDQAEQLLPQSLAAQMRVALERGRLLNSSGQTEQAKPFFLKAWELGQQQGPEVLTIDAAHMLAIVGSSEEQLEWNHIALQLCQQTQDSRAKQWLASLYNNLGWSYHTQGEYGKALEMLEKALVERELQGKLGAIRIAQWCVARALRSVGKTQQALEIQQALHESEAEGQTLGLVLEEIAECLLALGKPAEATGWFAVAYTELCKDTWLAKNEAGRLERLSRLAQEDILQGA